MASSDITPENFYAASISALRNPRRRIPQIPSRTTVHRSDYQPPQPDRPSFDYNPHVAAKLTRNLAAVNKAEQQIWNECSRLIANAIIHYNTLLLSRVYEQKLAAGDMDAIKVLRGISPVAWRNVHLIGAFDFTAARSSVDIDALAARFSDPEFWRRSMKEEDDERP